MHQIPNKQSGIYPYSRCSKGTVIFVFEKLFWHACSKITFLHPHPFRLVFVRSLYVKVSWIIDCFIWQGKLSKQEAKTGAITEKMDKQTRHTERDKVIYPHPSFKGQKSCIYSSSSRISWPKPARVEEGTLKGDFEVTLQQPKKKILEFGFFLLLLISQIPIFCCFYCVLLLSSLSPPLFVRWRWLFGSAAALGCCGL